MLQAKKLFIIIYFFTNLLFSQNNDETVTVEYNAKISINSNSKINLEFYIYFSKPVDSIELICNDIFLKKFKLSDTNSKYQVNIQKSPRNKVLVKSRNNIQFNEMIFESIIEINDSVKSRSVYFDENQFYLLPDNNYLPKINISQKTKINYHIDFENKNLYSYLNKNLYKNQIPYLILGNFEIENIEHISSYIPIGLNYNKERLSSIIKLVNSSLKYFTEIFGKPNNEKNFEVYFLRRTGGHGYPLGLILDQNYLNGGKELNNKLKLLIAHEVAHYWWGVNIETSQSSLFEGLCEYSAMLYMEENEDFQIKKYYIDKNIELEINPLEKIKFDTITPYDFKNNLYRSFSYLKLPIILKELEKKVGKKIFIEKLKKLFNYFKSSNEKITYYDFIESFTSLIDVDELKNDFLGIENEWTDFYIKKVIDNTVTYGVTGLHNKEQILVKIISFDDKIVYDTINFYRENEVEKKYDFKIKRIIIDPDFCNSQKTIINDVYDFKRLYSSNSKCDSLFNKKFYTFSDNIIEFLFYNHNEINTFVIVDELKSKLIEIADKTRKIKTNGFFMFVDEKKGVLKIMVSFSSSNKQNNIGYLEFSYYEKDNTIYLKSINKIKL